MGTMTRQIQQHGNVNGVNYNNWVRRRHNGDDGNRRHNGNATATMAMDGGLATAMGGTTAMAIEGAAAMAMDGTRATRRQQWQWQWTAQTIATAMECTNLKQWRLNSMSAMARDGAMATQWQQKAQW